MKKLKISKLNLDQDFLRLTRRLEREEVYASPRDKWLKVFRVIDPQDSEDQGYYFCERIGKDSVAFLLLDQDRPDKPFVCLEQYSSSHNKFTKGAYTGSLDKKDKSVEEIVQGEVKEESGYNIDLDRILSVGEMEVCSHSSEIVNLFLVDITGLEGSGKAGENIFEENMRDIRMNREEIKNHCEWKAQLITQRAYDYSIFED